MTVDQVRTFTDRGRAAQAAVDALGAGVPCGTSPTSQTSVSVSDSDYVSWFTKTEAAAAIGVTTKTVERLAADGKLQQALTQRQGRGPKLAVYHPDDVARIASERRTAPAAFVLPVGAIPPVPPIGGSTAIVRAEASSAPAEQLASVLCSLVAALRAVSETSKTTPTLFLTLDEAAAVSGLSGTYLKRRILAGTLPAERDGRRWRIRRRDLEAL